MFHEPCVILHAHKESFQDSTKLSDRREILFDLPRKILIEYWKDTGLLVNLNS
ncbi:hypothetical protein RB6314 [Rhodopirellula baltica SH 1]|uniref:Uncharacterized protein n=1 Tax=Rhodopirellula baltica (strain DSM 10527 / NCIMB 13988 / SH1) TaxID=243090 RepID=Q7UQI2_RHOBA|nr:hypothetical protein RB6314 [Rhodopirellula baltica SH 1]